MKYAVFKNPLTKSLILSDETEADDETIPVLQPLPPSQVI